MARAISYSQLRLFSQCPRAYYYRYEAGIRVPQTLRLVEGQAYHAAFEAGNRARLAGRSASTSEMEEHWHAYLDGVLAAEEVLSEGDELDEARRIVRPALLEYGRRIYPHLRPEEAELRFTADFRTETTTVTFTGVIDVVEAGALLDYKVHHRPRTLNVAGDPQLCLYAHFVPRPQTGIVELLRRRDPELRVITAEPGDVERDNALLWARRTVDAILACRSSGSWPCCAPDAWNCSERWCDFFGICYRRPLTPAPAKEMEGL